MLSLVIQRVVPRCYCGPDVMHLKRPVIVIVPSFDGIYNFPTVVSKYILDVYTEVYGLDLHNRDDIIFASGHRLNTLEASKKEPKYKHSRPYSKVKPPSTTEDTSTLSAGNYPLTTSGICMQYVNEYKANLEKAYQKSVQSYMDSCGTSDPSISAIAPRGDDLVSKQHCLVCSTTPQSFDTEEERLAWLLNWYGERPDAPDTEK